MSLKLIFIILKNAKCKNKYGHIKSDKELNNIANYFWKMLTNDKNETASKIIDKKDVC